MIVLLIGVGGVGEAIAVIAKSKPWIEKIILADYNILRAQEVRQKLGDPQRFPVEFVDANQQEQIHNLAQKYKPDLIMKAGCVNAMDRTAVRSATRTVSFTMSEPSRTEQP